MEWHCHVPLRSRAGVARKFSVSYQDRTHPERLRQLRNPTYS